MPDTPAETEVPTRVFLSYSRRDAALMNRVADALRARGFEPDFDQSSHDPNNVSGGISAEDEWWLRLQEMIAECDVMVFLASPDSAASSVCDEELAYARQTGKRIIPILARDIDFSTAPPRLAALNVKIDATAGGPAFDAAIDALEHALNVNVAWRREGRRLADRMAEWDRRERPASLLLRPGAVEEAEAWASRRPRNEPEPGEIYFDYVTASRKRNRADETRRRLWRRVTSALVLVAFGLMGWGLLSTLQGQRAAEETFSQFLTQASISAAETGDRARAVRLSVLAAQDTVLSPAARGAQFQLGRAVRAGPIPALLSDHAENREPPVFAHTMTEIAAPAGDEGVRIWRPDSGGAWTSATLATRSVAPDTIAYAPDDSLLFTASHTADDAELWRRHADGAWEATALAGHDGGVSAVAFAPDGRGFVTAARNFVVRVWAPDDVGEWGDTLLTGHQEYITAAAFSFDGRLFATASLDGVVRVWRLDEERGWSSVVLEHGQVYNNAFAAFSPTHSELLGVAGRARLWRERAHDDWEDVTPDDFPENVDRAEFSPDGDLLALASRDGSSVWRREASGDWRADMTCGSFVGFAPNGALYCIPRNGPIGDWRLFHQTSQGDWDVETMSGAYGSLTGASMSADGDMLATRTREGTLMVFPLDAAGAAPPAELVGHEDYLTVARFSPDGTRVVTASEDSTARVWEQNGDGEWRGTPLVMPRRRANVTAAAFAPDGDRIVTGAADRVWVWRHDVNGEWRLDATLEGHEQPITSAVFSSDGAHILSASEDRTARLWTETEPDVWTHETLTGHGRAVRSAAFSPDGRIIVTASDDEHAVLWRFDIDKNAWAPFLPLAGHGEEVVSAGFSPDGEQIITESSRSVRLWAQNEDGDWALTDMLDQGVVTDGGDGLNVGGGGAAFSPDGGRILTHGDFSSIATVWRRDRDGVWLRAHSLGAGESLFSATFSPSGRHVLTTDGDHVARIWDLPWLMPDSARTYAGRRAGDPMGPIVGEACNALKASSIVHGVIPGTGAPIVRHTQAEITATDIEAAPILRTMGLQVGENVCDYVTPGLLDKGLTVASLRIWPRQ